MNPFAVDYAKYAQTARLAAAEGCVLLRNENDTLPLRGTDTVAVFGRTQLNWYKSGTGSGGMVNVRRALGLVDALRESGVALDETLIGTYAAWVAEHPFDPGQGWAQEPWAQAEMPLTAELVTESAKRADIAVVIIGRTAGEDKDNKPEAGSYYLTADEESMLSLVTQSFARVAVVLNVGNIIDMRWVETYKPSAVLYAWHGGQEGGGSAADVLTGAVNPSGGLPDTIAREIDDYPSTKNFGDGAQDIYAEDIFVGYRWFESAARDAVLYPFGFGLSYTAFDTECIDYVLGETTQITVSVTNTGNTHGKRSVQVYVKAPQGALGKPDRVLAAYAKTDLLAPGGTQTLNIAFPPVNFASFDDSGVSGHRNAWVLEAGDYDVFVGDNVRDAELAFGFTISEVACLGHLHEALAPVTPFKRLRNSDNGITEEDAPLSNVDLAARIAANLPDAPDFTGDRGIKLADVYDGKADIDDFIAQIPNDVLVPIVRGEGMNSTKVTAGCGGAFGGLTEGLQAFGIPILTCTDGPSGLRFDAGGLAFSMPNGACLASSFNDALIEELFGYLGAEMRSKRVDLILGPGVNIHRSPLNGRNFEYFSEDPLLTGKMAAAQLRGLHKSKVSGTIKHFAANNREMHRFALDSVISARAQREIYLRGYEIAVKEGDCMAIMSTYGKVNGLFTAGSYDLTTTILRDQWGFDGIVMTDWWGSSADDENGFPSRTARAVMVRAQNDLQMCVNDTLAENANDDIILSLENGTLTRAELHRNARNILSVILRTAAIDRGLGRLPDAEIENSKAVEVEDKMQFIW
ncbi:MAG: glycoside hydrolase family 3 C-terminal domain-containing protein [Oscillospiraceae bacterium]|jgi:beta-glucosidase|nr:glycoside hydrolase family 3 C-terminal domain-containing protein [Oscillospiraceae bacterium]